MNYIIDLNEWDIDYTYLVRWALENEVELYAVNTYGANSSQKQYAFTQEEDFLAFKLTFQKDENAP